MTGFEKQDFPDIRFDNKWDRAQIFLTSDSGQTGMFNLKDMLSTEKYQSDPLILLIAE